METRCQNINCQCQNCQSCRGRNRAVLSAQRTAAAQARSTPAPSSSTAKSTASSGNAAAPVSTQPRSVKVSAFGRSYLSAYARDFSLKPEPQGATVPLEQQRVEGGYSFRRGVIILPEDGYYMLMWELGATHAQGKINLRLGVNQSGTMLNEAIVPGYDSGQQVTWLNKGDQISLQLLSEAEKPEFHANQALLTVLRMG